MDKPTVIFVGSVARNSRATGGQRSACLRLLDGPLSKRVTWKLVDTTMGASRVPGVRMLGAARRMATLGGLLAKPSPGSAMLVFSSYSSTSLLEKSTMCTLGKKRGLRTVLCVRSEVKPLGTRATALLRKMFANVDAFLCQTEVAKANLQRLFGVDPNKMTVVPNWIDVSKYSGDGATEDREPMQVLFVGALEPWKGGDDFLAALDQLEINSNKVHVRFYGDGSERTRWQAESEKRGLGDIVTFHGSVEETQMLDAYASADLLVLPSHTEGLPNAVLEAMAAALPVVATKVGGVPELVVAGETGELVPPKDPDELAKAMDRILSDRTRARDMGQKGRARAKARHDVVGASETVAQLLLGP